VVEDEDEPMEQMVMGQEIPDDLVDDMVGDFL
jgi:hypothetical protein